MVDDPDPLPVGSRGTVREVRPIGAGYQVDVDWDPGVDRSLMLLSTDPWEVVP